MATTVKVILDPGPARALPCEAWVLDKGMGDYRPCRDYAVNMRAGVRVCRTHSRSEVLRIHEEDMP